MDSVISPVHLSIVNILIAAVYVASILTVPGTLGNTKVPFFVIFLIPVFNILTDFNYIMTSEFYSVWIYVACCAFLVVPNLYFVVILLSVRGKETDKPAYPSMLYNLYPGLHVHQTLWWLRQSGGVPVDIRSDLPARLPTGLDSLPVARVLALVGLWTGLCLLQLVSLALYAVWLCAALCFLVIWLVVGMLVYQNKTLSTRRVWNGWFHLWTGDQEFHKSDGQVDLAVFNGSLLAEFVLEALPQLGLQCANNALTGSWGPIALASLVSSLLVVLVGGYRYCYWGYVRGENVLAIHVLVSVRTLLGIQSSVSSPVHRATSGGRRSSGAEEPGGEQDWPGALDVELQRVANPLA
jgi:hypothetical protein